MQLSHWLARGLVVAWLSSIPSGAHAQTWVRTAMVGNIGPVESSRSVLAEMKPGTELSIPLDSRFTGAEYRWTFTYRIARLPGDYPEQWLAAAHVSIRSADGQNMGRVVPHTATSSTTDGTFTFYGEEHAQHRPTDLRLTFSQSASAAYRINGTLSVSRERGANLGGAERSRPLWLQVGTPTDPSWTTGDFLLAPGEFHRHLLFAVAPGTDLMLRFIAPPTQGFNYLLQVRDLDHRALGPVQYHGANAGVTSDRVVHRNVGSTWQWVLVEVAPQGVVQGHRMGWYSPTNAGLNGSGPSLAPSAWELNPFAKVADSTLSVQTRIVETSDEQVFNLPQGPGAVLRLRIRVLDLLFLKVGGGTSVSFTVYSRSGKPMALNRYGATEGYIMGASYGLNAGEGFREFGLEIPSGPVSADDQPGWVKLSKRFDPCQITVEADRYYRVR